MTKLRRERRFYLEAMIRWTAPAARPRRARRGRADVQQGDLGAAGVEADVVEL